MNKSALVMDTPKNCYDCPFGTEYCGDSEYEGCCELAECLDSDMRLITEEHYDYESKSRPEWCPLKPLPEKKEYINSVSNIEATKKYCRSWLECLFERNYRRGGIIMWFLCQEPCKTLDQARKRAMEIGREQT